MSAPKLSKVFVYGSLMCNQVLETLLGRIPQQVEGTVSGYRRYCIRDRVYPAVASKRGGTVEGLLLEALTEKEMHIFDEFEDDGYDRVKVVVRTEAPKREVVAEMYLWATGTDVLHGDWSYERDYVPHREEYLKMCSAFIREYHRENST